MLNTIYTELKESFEDIQKQIKNFKKDFSSTGTCGNKQGIIFNILNNIEFEKFLIYKLNQTEYGFFLKIFDDNFTVEITQLWHKLYPYYRRINSLKGFLRYDQRRLLMNKNPNLELINNKVNALYVVYLIYINLDSLKENMIITKMLENKIQYFLRRKNPNPDKISFQMIISLLQTLYSKKIINEDLINNFEIHLSEWESLKNTTINNKDNILSEFYNNPELYENEFELFYNSKKKILQEKGLAGEGGNQTINNLKLLTTYYNIKKSYENLMKLSIFELFLLKLIYNFDIKKNGKETLQYLLPIYLLHFAKDYNEYKKIKYIFYGNFQIKYLFYTLLGILVLIGGNIMLLLGGIIIIFSRLLSNIINNFLKIRFNYNLIFKAIGIILMLYGSLNSNYLQLIENISSGNFYADITKGNIKIQDLTNVINGKIKPIKTESQSGIGININEIQDLITYNKYQSTNYYLLQDNEKISDVVNGFIPLKYRGKERVEIIDIITKEYIEIYSNYLSSYDDALETKDYKYINDNVKKGMKIDINMINKLVNEKY